jgi:hypothetical protein
VQGIVKDGSIIGDGEVTASFLFDGVYINETTETVVELKQENGAWKVNNFYIISTLLTD